MSDNEIVSAVDTLVENEKEAQRQVESEKILEMEISKEILELENSIQEKRSKVKELKEKKSTERKQAVKRKREVALKKKSNGNQLKPPTVDNLCEESVDTVKITVQ